MVPSPMYEIASLAVFARCGDFGFIKFFFQYSTKIIRIAKSASFSLKSCQTSKSHFPHFVKY